MQRLVDEVAPPRLGTGFRWLLGSSWMTNLGDGLALAAGPLLIAEITGNAALVGLTWAVARLPWLLFGLHSGVVADRFNRRNVVIVANGVRMAVLGVFTLAIAGGSVNAAVIMAALFAMASAEVFADNASNTLMPMLVAKDDLTLGNSRMVFGFVGLNQLIGPPIGAFLFAAAFWIPFGLQTAVMGMGILLVRRIALDAAAVPAQHARTDTSPSTEIVDGIRWIWGNPPMRTLALTIFSFNIAFGASFSVMVVLAEERLGLNEVGFGLLISASAIGGILGSVLYRRTEKQFGVVTIMRVGLTIESFTHLVLAISTVAAPAFIMLFFFGMHEAMWGTTSTSIRQAVVPMELQGRVGSVYKVGLHSGLIVGAGVGALLVRFVDVTAPYWFGFLGSLSVLALIWRELARIAASAEDA